MLIDHFKQKIRPDKHSRTLWQSIHIDITLLSLLLLLAATGLFILYSASGESLRTIELQAARLLIAFTVMFLFAQISPVTLQRSAMWLYGIGIFTLVIVLIIGHIGKGAQRWLNLGIIHFQPAELMKLAIPLLLADYYHKNTLPISLKSTLAAVPIIFIPALLTAKQPDLGTAILLTCAGASVLFFAGLSFRIIFALGAGFALVAPFAWYILHDYQRQRVLTFLNPENDPLGTGYHIIQSKIAIGSGSFFGKGWLNGTQSNLHFLPEHTTDFIFAVCGEEFGFVGSLFLIILFMSIVLRGLYITLHAQDTFSRLVAGSITFTFFISFFINCLSSFFSSF